jgi:hypothetical protein
MPDWPCVLLETLHVALPQFSPAASAAEGINAKPAMKAEASVIATRDAEALKLPRTATAGVLRLTAEGVNSRETAKLFA